jgi:hypothetical protein
MYAIRECYKVSISKDIVIKAVLNFWVFSILNWLVVPGTGPFRCSVLATLQCRHVVLVQLLSDTLENQENQENLYDNPAYFRNRSHHNILIYMHG